MAGIPKKKTHSAPLHGDPFILVLPISALVLFAAPYFRGLFFREDVLPTAAVISLLFLLTAGREAVFRRPALGLSRIDYAALALALAYWGAVLVAADKSAAVLQALRQSAFFMFYFTVSRAVASFSTRADHLLRTVVLSGAGVAFIGVGAAAGFLELPGAVANGRILSTFQYHNTLGSFLAVASLLALSLWGTGNKRWGWMTLGAIFLMNTAILGTYSRGTWVTYVAALAALVALSPAGARGRLLYGQAAAAFLAALAARGVLAGAGAPGYHGVKGLVLGVALVVLAHFAFFWVRAWLQSHEIKGPWRAVIGVTGVVYGVVFGAWYFAYAGRILSSPVAQIIPPSVVYRAETIGNQDASVTGRYQYMADALRIIKDHPVLGAGGGGWNALYHQYQPYLYWTTEVHNGFLQTGVEAGLLGLGAFLAAWAMFAIAGIRLLRRLAAELEPGTGPGLGGEGGGQTACLKAAGVMVAASALGAHSFIDFDLSFAAVSLLLWALFGIMAGWEAAAFAQAMSGDRVGGGVRDAMASSGGLGGGSAGSVRANLGARAGRGGRAAGFLALMAGAAAAGALSLRLYNAGAVGAEGARYLASGDWGKAVPLLERAMELDPWQGSFAFDLAQVYAAGWMAEKRQEYWEESRKHLAEAVRRQPRDLRLAMRTADLYASLGMVDMAAEQAERVAELLPMSTGAYEGLVRASLNAAVAQLAYGEPDRARSYLDKVIAVPGLIEGRTALSRGRRWPGALPAVTQEIELAVGQALYLEGRYQEAAGRLEPLKADKRTGYAAGLWMAAALEKQGRLEESRSLLKDMERRWSRDPMPDYLRILEAPAKTGTEAPAK